MYFTYNILDVTKVRILFEMQQLVQNSKLSPYTNKWLQTGIKLINYLKPQIFFWIELILTLAALLHNTTKIWIKNLK